HHWEDVPASAPEAEAHRNGSTYDPRFRQSRRHDWESELQSLSRRRSRRLNPSNHSDEIPLETGGFFALRSPTPPQRPRQKQPQEPEHQHAYSTELLMVAPGSNPTPRVIRSPLRLVLCPVSLGPVLQGPGIRIALRGHLSAIGASDDLCASGFLACA